MRPPRHWNGGLRTAPGWSRRPRPSPKAKQIPQRSSESRGPIRSLANRIISGYLELEVLSERANNPFLFSLFFSLFFFFFPFFLLLFWGFFGPAPPVAMAGHFT